MNHYSIRSYFSHPLSTLFALLAAVISFHSCTKDGVIPDSETVSENSVKTLTEATEAETYPPSQPHLAWLSEPSDLSSKI